MTTELSGQATPVRQTLGDQVRVTRTSKTPGPLDERNRVTRHCPPAKIPHKLGAS